MKRLITFKKVVLAMVLLSVTDSAAFSLKSFLSEKAGRLQKVLHLKKDKDAAQEGQVPEQSCESDGFESDECEQKDAQKSELVPEQKSMDRPIITVWIHGTSHNPLFGGLKKDDPRGLLKMEMVNESQKSKKAAIALTQYDAHKFPNQSFYFFRWSGKLSYKKREEEAFELYEELAHELEKYREEYGVAPYVRIITHSHGGNLALNLAKAQNADENFSVDQLILLACPVQETTAHLIKDPMFKKVYVFYSAHDFMQVAAPQGLGFSGRRFPVYPNVVQAKVKINGKSPGHFTFVKPEFMRHLAVILTRLEHQRYAGSRVRVNSHQLVC